MSEPGGASGGIGLVTLLTVIFVLAKIFSWGPVGGWSWWLVFSPVLVSWGLVLAIVAISLLAAGVLHFWGERR